MRISCMPDTQGIVMNNANTLLLLTVHCLLGKADTEWASESRATCVTGETEVCRVALKQGAFLDWGFLHKAG